MPQVRGNKFLKHQNGMEMLQILMCCCFSGTMETICKTYFIILSPHTQLTTSLISVVTHSNNTFMGDQK